MSTMEIGFASGEAKAPAVAPPRGVLRDLPGARGLPGLPETLARLGALELRFAVTKADIQAVQEMRYRVFFEDGGALADPLMRARRRDDCPHDRVCDHLVVVDHDAVAPAGRRGSKVVGAYRVLRQDAIASAGEFYAAGDFDIARLIARHPDKRFLELGRSCVLPEYRARRVLELLWRGVWTYVRHHRVDVMFGCASLPGAEPREHADALAFLREHARAGEEWRTRALQQTAHSPAARLDGGCTARRAVASLPPLIKGYLRLGACFSDEVFVDRAFRTTDVLVVLPVANIDARYIEHFGGPAAHCAAA